MGQTETLFRQEALRALQTPVGGAPIGGLPITWSALTLLLSILLVAAIALAPLLSWHRTELARGWLIPGNGAVDIATDTGGRVDALLVTVGDQVESGEALLRLTRDRRLPDGRSKGAEDIQQLQQQIDETERQLQLVDRRSSALTTALDAKLAGMRREYSLLEGQQQVLQSRLGFATEKLLRLKNAGDAVAAWRRLEQQDNVEERRFELGQVAARVAILRRDIDAVLADKVNAPMLADQERSVLRARREALRRELTQVESERQQILVSPVAGTIAGIDVVVGEQALPAQPLLTVLAAGQGTTVELFVSAAAIPYLHDGDSIEIAFDAYPRDRFAPTPARITSIDGFVTSQAMQTAAPLHQPAYRISAVLADTDLNLRAGMTLSARLILERRSLLDWLLRPLRQRAGG